MWVCDPVLFLEMEFTDMKKEVFFLRGSDLLGNTGLLSYWLCFSLQPQYTCRLYRHVIFRTRIMPRVAWTPALRLLLSRTAVTRWGVSSSCSCRVALRKRSHSRLTIPVRSQKSTMTHPQKTAPEIHRNTHPLAVFMRHNGWFNPWVSMIYAAFSPIDGSYVPLQIQAKDFDNSHCANHYCLVLLLPSARSIQIYTNSENKPAYNQHLRISRYSVRNTERGSVHFQKWVV